MRVITGLAKGRRLTAPEGLETRPTLELVKEAVFSMIQFEIEGSAVLDLFAGSGQMGIEALSRGARSCVFVDNSRICTDIISENLKRAGFPEKGKILQSDAFNYVRHAQGPFDIAFIDPPYQKADLKKLLLPLSEIISESGAVICETGRADEPPQSSGTLLNHKEYRYGKTKITVYRQSPESYGG